MADSTFWAIVANIYLAAAIAAPRGTPDSGVALIIAIACAACGFATR